MSDDVETPGAAVRHPSRAALAFYAICRVVAVGLSSAYWPGPVIGSSRLPANGAYLLAPLHRSNVDWLVVARVTRRRLRYLVKAEVWKVPLIGRFIELLGAFSVRRGSPDRESLNRCLEVLAEGEPLVVFPEGTRQAGAEVGPLLEGAAYMALRSGVPIVPVGLAGTEAAMPRGKRLPRPGRVVIVIGEPILPWGVDATAQRPGRVARSATRVLTETLRSSIEQASADAASLLGSRHGPRVGSRGGTTAPTATDRAAPASPAGDESDAPGATTP